MTNVRQTLAASEVASGMFDRERSGGREVRAAIVAQPSGVVGVLITGLYLLAGLFAGWVSPWPPLETHTMDALLGPSAQYWLGTDELGRDVLSRIIYGIRPSLTVAVTAVVGGGTAGITLGIVAGYYRGVLEAVVMRICDIAFAFPLILIGVCTVIVLGKSNLSVGIAVGIGVTPTFARLARAEVLEEMERDYVKASRGMGASDAFVMLRHILPNIMATVVVQLATAVSAAIILASALDFLGMGTQPPQPSWGNMLQASRLYLTQNPTYALAPGIALTTFVIGINLLAAALTNAIDPRIRTDMMRRRHGPT